MRKAAEMIIDIYCINCREFIYQADTHTLKKPLEGHMFPLRPDREWVPLPPDAKDMDLVCPMCSWTFHEYGKLLVMHPSRRELIVTTTGTMAMQLGLIRGKTARERSVEDFYEAHIPDSYRKEQEKKRKEEEKRQEEARLARNEKLKKENRKPLEQEQAEMKERKLKEARKARSERGKKGYRGKTAKKKKKKTPQKRGGRRNDTLKRILEG